MTKAELNRDIKRLGKRSITKGLRTHKEETEMKIEFKRLYRAAQADKFKTINRKSIMVLTILNRRFRVEPFHMFMIAADMEDFL